MLLTYLDISLMKNDWSPKEVIVVEGRSDTQRLQETFGPNIKTIETNGSAVSRKLRPELERAAEQFGIIIFTDPDYQGERIRRLITEMIPNAKHAYLKPEQAQSKVKHASLGVEHASTDVIREALLNIASPMDDQEVEPIPQSVLIELGLIGGRDSKEKRQFVADEFKLGYVNGKQLRKKLSFYRIDEKHLRDKLTEWRGNKNE